VLRLRNRITRIGRTGQPQNQVRALSDLACHFTELGGASSSSLASVEHEGATMLGAFITKRRLMLPKIDDDTLGSTSIGTCRRRRLCFSHLASEWPSHLCGGDGTLSLDARPLRSGARPLPG